METVTALRTIHRGMAVSDGQGLTLYVGAMTLGQLGRQAKVDMWSPSNADE